MANPKFTNPSTVSKPPGYTHVVEVTSPGRIIYIAGQLGLDVNNNIVGGPGDFRAQAVQTFENLKNALAAVGASFKDVVKMNNYLTSLSYLPIFREVRDAYVNTSAPPASTTIEIPKLAREGALLESEAIVVLPGRALAASARRGTAKKSAPKKSAKKAAKKKRR